MKTVLLGLVVALTGCASDTEDSPKVESTKATKPVQEGATATGDKSPVAEAADETKPAMSVPDMIAICKAAKTATSPMSDEERYRFFKELPVSDAKTRTALEAITSAAPNQLGPLMGAIAKEAGEQRWDCPAFDALFKQ